MFKRVGSSIPVLFVVLVGCTIFPKAVMPLRVHDIHISGQNSINPVELYAVVGQEIRWRNASRSRSISDFLVFSQCNRQAVKEGSGHGTE
ncbi:MAG: hypothetical protein ACXWWB_03440 [Nitrospira sp.]